MSFKQSFCFPIFKNAAPSLDELFASAAEFGYPATEFWGWDDGSDAAVDAAHRAGLEIASFTGHDGIQSGLNDASQHDRILLELEISIRMAEKIRCPGVICFAGERINGQTDYEGMVVAATALRRIAPLAEELGVNLNLEILNSRVDHFNYVGDTVEWGTALCEMVQSSRVKILFDIYHVQIMQGDVIRRLRAAMPHIGHVHTAGNPGRNEMDDTQELNYRGIAAALSASGYRDYVGHEFFPKGADKLAALKDAFDLFAA
jgi:hydroxypyruvate isomerase